MSLRWGAILGYTLTICLASAAGGLFAAIIAQAQLVPRVFVGPLLGAFTMLTLVGTFTVLGYRQLERTAAHACWVAIFAWAISGLNVLMELSSFVQWLGAAAVILCCAVAGVAVGISFRSSSPSIAREAEAAEPRRWPISRIFKSTLLIGTVWFGTQIAVVAALFVDASAADPELDLERWAINMDADGGALVWLVFFGASAAVLATYLVLRRHEADPWRLLGFRACSWSQLFMAAVAIVVFTAASDAVTVALDKPLVPSFAAQVYATAPSMILLVIAIVLVAPLAEEIVFRGFLLGACEAGGVKPLMSLTVASGLWAVVHLQYDAYGMATIFALGLLLGVTRLRTSSIFPCILMHAIANAVSLTEAAVFAS